jgi:hypothetical protein
VPTRSRSWCWLFGIAQLLFASQLLTTEAGAETPSTNERALAEALFREARELMQAGRYAEACGKFAESQRLDPAGGTLLNLAVCHEAEGKTASAWAEFQEALAIARADGRQDRVDLASEHISALEPRLSKIVVDVSEDRPDGLLVSINRMTVGAAGWGSAVPVDPGRVEIRAEAPGHVSFAKKLEISEAEELRVAIPRLVRAQSAPASRVPEAGPSVKREASGKTGAYVVGAVGVAALAVGGYFGVRAMREKSKADDNGCDANSCSTVRGHEADKNAVFNGWLSTAGLAAGVAALGVATYLYLDSDAEAEALPGASQPARSPARYAMYPSVGTSGASLWFNAVF